MSQLRSRLKFTSSPSLKKRITFLCRSLGMDWVKNARLFVYSSTGSKTRAYARTWGLPRLWQESLKVAPAYIIEVISERFNKLSKQDQDKVLLHELTHIPKNFSGALVPHTHKRKGSFHKKLESLIRQYMTKYS